MALRTSQLEPVEDMTSRTLELRNDRTRPTMARRKWAEHKDVIVRLYQTEGLTLDEVKEIMSREYRFIAATRTYRMYFKKWNVRKYRKHTEDAPTAWRPRPRPSPPAREKPPEIPDFGAELMPDTQFQHIHTHVENPYAFPKRNPGPRPDTLDVFPSWWTDRSPSVSAASAASDYSGASVYDPRTMENVFAAPAPRDTGHSLGRPPSGSASASAASDYSGASVYDRPTENVLIVPALSDRAYSPGPEQRLERDFACLVPMGGIWDGSGVMGSGARGQERRRDQM